MESNKSFRKILIGLGNPGKEYENTYHNAGFLAIDFLAGDKKNSPGKKLSAKKFEYSKNKNLIFAKPLTYMNDSGIAVKNALKFFGVSAEELLVIHDDSDIPIGEYKISFERGSAGHKGIESIIQHIHTNKFWRLRIGVRPKEEGGKNLPAGDASKGQKKERLKAGEFVLKKISPQDRQLLLLTFKIIAKETKNLS